MTCAAHCREIEKREARISWLEAEVQRQGNIITELADALMSARLGERMWHIHLEQVKPTILGYEWTPAGQPPRPRLLHPSEIKILSTSIGIREGQGGSVPRAE